MVDKFFFSIAILILQTFRKLDCFLFFTLDSICYKSEHLKELHFTRKTIFFKALSRKFWIRKSKLSHKNFLKRFFIILKKNIFNFIHFVSLFSLVAYLYIIYKNIEAVFKIEMLAIHFFPLRNSEKNLSSFVLLLLNKI